MTAFIFSGQGAQFSGMGLELYGAYAECREVFDRGGAAAGFGLKEICFDDDKTEMLNDTKYCQASIFVMSAAVLALLEGKGIRADFAAGLSLGEYTALYYAGAVGFEDGVRLLERRGAFMALASDAVDGVMSAVMGIEPEAAAEICAKASAAGESVNVSNVNTVGQVVISGARAAVERAEALFKEMGFRKSIRLPVSGPYHSVYMAPAAQKLEEHLKTVTFSDMAVPVVSNVDAEVISGKGDIADKLVRQVCSTVRWMDCVRRLGALGADTFVEIGPGRALSGFVKKILPEARIFNIQDKESFELTVSELK